MASREGVAAKPLRINPDPLAVVAVPVCTGCRMRAPWCKCGAMAYEIPAPEAREEVSAMQNIKVGRYEHPDSTGYLGWIEPEDASWIAFVRDDHVPEVYLDRDETGAVV